MDRPTFEEWALKLAENCALRSTCARRQAGAVAVDEHNRIVSVGYNGVPRGFVHCTDVPCAGADEPSGGSASDNCIAVHAEINCIINAERPYSVYRMFLTASPCFKCALALANLPCLEEVIYLEDYPDDRGRKIIRQAGVKLTKHRRV